MAYVVSRFCLCRVTMFHIQTTFCQANRFGTKQPSTSYRHATLNLWYLVFWQVYIRRSYQAYELTTLYHEKVPFFSFLSFPPRSYRIVMLVINFNQVQWLSCNKYLYWTNEGISLLPTAHVQLYSADWRECLGRPVPVYTPKCTSKQVCTLWYIGRNSLAVFYKKEVQISLVWYREKHAK